jgi:phage I-like protein
MYQPVNPLSLTLLTAQVTTLAAVTHASVEIAALPDGEAKAVWNKLVPAGTFRARDGRGPFHAGGKAQMEAILARTLKYAGETELMVDYDHQSFMSAVKGVGGTAKAAGWIKQLEVREDGIWGLIEWTALAARAIKRNEYRYLSPSFSNDKAGNIGLIFNAGLLNMPAMDLVAVAAGVDLSNSTEPDMKNIAQLLGLAEDADEAAIIAALNKILTDRKTVVTTAGLKPEATTEELVTTLAALKTASTTTPDPTKFVPIDQVTALQTEVTTLKADILGGRAEAAVDQAIEKGKLLPALRDWGLTLFKADQAQFTAFIDKAPSLTTTQLGSKKVDATSNDGLTDADERVIQLMGVSREDFLKSRKAELGEVA